MARKNLSNDIEHDGTVDTFLARQAENLLHWAAPKLENARAWGEVSAAYGTVGGKAAAHQTRRFAEDDLAPRAKDARKRVDSAVHDRYEKIAPAVAAGAGVVGSTLQDLLSAAQDKAQQAGQEIQDRTEQARKDAEKAAKKGRKDRRKLAKRGEKKARRLKKDARGVAKQASKKADRAQSLFAAKAADAKDSAAQGGLTLAGLLAAAVSAAQGTSQDLAPQVRERLEQAQRFAQDRREEYAPKAAAKLADVADRAEKGARDVEVPAAVEQLLVALTGDKAVVSNLRKNAQKTAHQAKKDLRRQARAESGHRGWIVAGMAAALAGAGVAVWKLTKPVQDPWTAPVPGPITANIPVVQADGTVNPYAQQERVVAEARGGRVDAVADANARVLGQERQVVVEREVVADPEPRR